MAGILNQEKDASAGMAASVLDDDGAPSIKNPTLRRIDAQMDAKVPQASAKMYDGIIVSSMAIMYDKSSRQFIKQRMQATPNMAMNAANGVADVIMMVFQNSGQDKQPEQAQPFFDAAVMACVPLMCQVLDLAEQLGVVKVDAKLIDQATKLTYKETMRRFGVSEQMIRDQVAKGKGAAAPNVAPQAGV